MGTAAKPTSTHAAPHPLAGSQMTCADTIVQVLADEGVDTLFGYSGGAILPTYDAIFRYNESHPDREMRLIVPATEQGAGFMAAGRSEEHTSELQSRENLVCRLLLEKKKKNKKKPLLLQEKKNEQKN